MFDQNTGAFYDVDLNQLAMTKALPPPENCPCCIQVDQLEREKDVSITKDEDGEVNGFAYRGQKYHYEDFVRYYSESGPAHIGYITELDVAGGSGRKEKRSVTCRKVGRIADLGRILPPETMRDEVSNTVRKIGAR
jgi:DNA (cytosine-5)-methyltransferase 1